MCAFYILHLHIIIHLPILDLHISTSYICASYIFASYICTSYIFTSYICTSYIFTSCICTFYTCTSSLMHIFPLQIIHLNILHLRLLHLQIIHLNILQFLYPLCLSTSLSLFLPLGLLHTVSLCLFFLVSLSLSCILQILSLLLRPAGGVIGFECWVHFRIHVEGACALRRGMHVYMFVQVHLPI